MVGDDDKSATTTMTKEKSAADMARPTLGSGAVRCVDSETGREGPRGDDDKDDYVNDKDRDREDYDKSGRGERDKDEYKRQCLFK